MSIKFSALNLHDLKNAEQAYRFVLCQQPDNMDIRVNLAWCLLFQALYRSGEETASDVHRSAAEARPQADATNFLPTSDSKQLLQECLRHTMMVKQLSASVSHLMDVDKLEAMVLMAGGKDLLIANEARGTRIRSEILLAAYQTAGV